MTRESAQGRWHLRVVRGRSGLDKLVDGNRELEQLLADGWEPFGVATYGGDYLALRLFEPAAHQRAIA